MAAGNFFGGEFFGGGFFGAATSGPPLGGKEDNDKRRPRAFIDEKGRIRYIPVKPTGLIERPKKEGRKEIADRVDESVQIAADVSAKLAREFTDESAQIAAQQLAAQEILDASMSEMDREIAFLLRKKLRAEEDMMLLLLLVTASAV